MKNILGDEIDAIMDKFIRTHADANWSWNKLSFEKHMDLLKKIASKYEGIDGFNKSIRDALNNSNPNVQDGFWHMIQDLDGRNLAKDRIKKFDLLFNGNDLPCANCKFDIELNAKSPKELKYIEYKSYQNASKIPKPQFLNYITNIESIEQLQYVFSSKKLSITQAKLGMQEFFTTNIDDIFETIWKNKELRTSIFGELSESQMNLVKNSKKTAFKELIEIENSILYTFVK